VKITLVHPPASSQHKNYLQQNVKTVNTDVLWYMTEHALTLIYQTTRRHIPGDYSFDIRSYIKLNHRNDCLL
jgi:hypothetical protein